MKNYKKIISEILIIFMICFSGSAVFALSLNENADYARDESGEEISYADLNGKHGDSTTLNTGEIRSSYHSGNLMEASDKEAVLAAMNDEKMSQVINDIYNGIKAYQDNVPLEKYEINPEELSVCYSAVMNNKPDMYYASNRYKYTIFEDGLIDAFYPEYTMDSDEMTQTQAEIDDEVDKILAQIQPGMNRMDQITSVTNYFAEHYTYDHEHYNNPGDYVRHYTIPALFIDKTAVCQGFGLGFQYVMEKLNIPCVTVQSQAMGHLWNLVQAKEGSENWYHIDSTWNSQWSGESNVNPYIFFMKSDNGIKNVSYYDVEYPHHDYTPDGWAEDESYDNLPLTKVGGTAVYGNGKWYYGKDKYDWTSADTIKAFDFSTLKEEGVVTVGASWTPEGSGGWAYEGYYWSNAVAYNNKLYYNDASNIYVFDPSTGKSSIYKASPEGVVKNSQCIYEIKLSGNQLIYTTAGNYPGTEATTYEHTITLPSSGEGNMLEVKDGTANVTLTGIDGANNICFAFFGSDGRFIGANMIEHDGTAEASVSDEIPADSAELSVFAVNKSSSGIKPIGTSVHKTIN
ncbi:MAG: hypothetical protein Q4G33_12900 [bacterium]|nr:hypothetical protein [bacterium]